MQRSGDNSLLIITGRSQTDWNISFFRIRFFLFPDFDQLNYSEEKDKWQVDYDGNWSPLEEAWQRQLDKLESQGGYPVKLLVERSMIPCFDLRQYLIPSCVFLTGSYEKAFEAEESPLQMIIPRNTKELYERLLKKPDLCGHMKWLENEGIMEWQLYKNMKLEEILRPPMIVVLSLKNGFSGTVEASVTHRLGLFEIYDELCRIGKEGPCFGGPFFLGKRFGFVCGAKRRLSLFAGQKMPFGQAVLSGSGRRRCLKKKII